MVALVTGFSSNCANPLWKSVAFEQFFDRQRLPRRVPGRFAREASGSRGKEERCGDDDPTGSQSNGLRPALVHRQVSGEYRQEGQVGE